jgi:hypothetical protein
MCAKPQREEDVPPPEPVHVAWTPPPPPAIAPVGFHNRIAVQIGMMAACIAALLCSVAPLFKFAPVWMSAASFLAVYLYHRRTGQPLTTRAGARMGWITGAFLFGIAGLMFTITFVSQANSGQFAADFQQQMRRMPVNDPEATAQVLKMLQSPAGQAVIVLFLLVFLFAVIMSFCAAGGALGAKILSKD